MFEIVWFLLFMFFSNVKSDPYHNICPFCTDHGLVDFFQQGWNEYLLVEDYRDYAFEYLKNRQCMHSHYEKVRSNYARKRCQADLQRFCKATCFRVRLLQIERNRTLILGWAFGCTEKTVFAIPPTIPGAPPDLKNIRQDYTFEDHLYGREGKKWMLDFDIYKHDYDVEEAQIYYRKVAEVHQRQKERKDAWIKCQQDLWKCHYNDFKNSEYVPYAMGIGAVGVIVFIVFCWICIKINMCLCGCSKKKTKPYAGAMVVYKKSNELEDGQVVIGNGERYDL